MLNKDLLDVNSNLLGTLILKNIFNNFEISYQRDESL